MQEQQPIKHKITICLISTRKYFIFVQPLIDSICKYFLLRHDIEVHVFTDNITLPYYGNERVTITKHQIESYGFPEATLFRYAIMTSIEYDSDYIYYLDADMMIVSEIDEEILGDIVAVLHPGFSCVGGGSWCTDENSLAFTFEHDRKLYFAGGVQGGKTEHFYAVMVRLKTYIEGDRQRGVKAEWNDESHWNSIVPTLRGVKVLDSSYCLVEQKNLQKAWKIDHLPKRIIALSKDHEKIRS